jgi:hypothetical protein
MSFLKQNLAALAMILSLGLVFWTTVSFSGSNGSNEALLKSLLNEVKELKKAQCPCINPTTVNKEEREVKLVNKEDRDVKLVNMEEPDIKLSLQQVNALYAKVNLPDSYFAAKETTWKQFSDLDHWRGKDVPRIFCVMDFIDWVKKYDIKSSRGLAADPGDREWKFVQTDKVCSFCHSHCSVTLLQLPV